MYSAYLPATVKPFFGDTYANFPNGIPAIEVPYRPGGRFGFDDGVPVLLHVGSDSAVRAG